MLTETPTGTNPFIRIQVGPYRGRNPHVYKMVEYLKNQLGKDLIGAYIHGSLGTYEEVEYSDFDALVIIKNEVFESPERLSEVAKKLSNARAIMFNFDPLQHHGWFVLTEADLRAYPEYYFPSELFLYAKSLFPDRGLELEIQIQNSSKQIRESFDKLNSSIIKRMTKKDYPRNMYELKSLMSQFMLLPALYVQVRDKKGIYKKFSFDAAKVDFMEEDWSVMDEVSALRENWFYEISLLKRWLITRPTPLSRFLAKKYSPVIPEQIRRVLTDDFYHRMGHLAITMQRNIY
jgi:predicted nucleotidyltransferase